MLELGDYEEEGHLKVGCRAADVAAQLIVVGELAETLARGARLCGLSRDRIHVAADNDAAVAIIEDLLQPDDIILVKASRALYMENIVAQLQREA